MLGCRTVPPVRIPGGQPIPALVGDLGRRLLDTIDFGQRSLVLALVLGGALVTILLVDEIGYVLRPEGDRRRPRRNALVVPLTVAVATVIFQRLFTIVQ